jgi:hypothetical protein
MPNCCDFPNQFIQDSILECQNCGKRFEQVSGKFIGLAGWTDPKYKEIADRKFKELMEKIG